MHTPPVRSQLSQLLRTVKALSAIEHTRLVDILTMEDEARLKNMGAAYFAAVADPTRWLPGSTMPEPPGEPAEDNISGGSQHPLYAPTGATPPLCSSPGDRASKRQTVERGDAEIDTEEMNLDPIQPAMQPDANSLTDSGHFSHTQDHAFINSRANGQPFQPAQQQSGYPTLPHDASLGYIPPAVGQAMWHPFDQMNMMYGMHLGPNQGPGWMPRVYSPFQSHMLASQGHFNQGPTHSPMAPGLASPLAQPGLQNSTPTPLPRQAPGQAPTSIQSGVPPFPASQSQQPPRAQPAQPAQPSQPGPSGHTGTSTASATSTGNTGIFTDAPSSNISYTDSHPSSLNAQPSVGGSMGILDFSRDVPIELGEDRYGKSWSSPERDIIIVYWVGQQAPPNYVNIALSTPRNPKLIKHMDPAWTNLAAGPFHGCRDVTTIISQWWSLVDTYCALVASEPGSGPSVNPALSTLDHSWQQFDDALKAGRVLRTKNQLKKQDLAPWFKTHQWFALMNRIRLHPNVVSRVVDFRGGDQPRGAPRPPANPLRARRAKSNKSDKSLSRAALNLMLRSPPPPSADGSGVGSVQQPTQLSQSSWIGDELAVDNVPIPAIVPPNYASTVEMVRSQHGLYDAEIKLANAKAEYFKTESQSVYLGDLDSIMDMDLKMLVYQRETAFQVLNCPTSTQKAIDEANACLTRQLAASSSTADLPDLYRRRDALRRQQEEEQEGPSAQEGSLIQGDSLVQEAANASGSVPPEQT